LATFGYGIPQYLDRKEALTDSHPPFTDKLMLLLYKAITLAPSKTEEEKLWKTKMLFARHRSW
jgi:hypothetical protein